MHDNADKRIVPSLGEEGPASGGLRVVVDGTNGLNKGPHLLWQVNLIKRIVPAKLAD